MIADIFYPIFTLTITVLACFTQKNKVVRGFHTHDFIKASPWTLWGAVTPPDPSCNQPMRPYFFCFIPCATLNTSLLATVSKAHSLIPNPQVSLKFRRLCELTHNNYFLPSATNIKYYCPF